MSTASEHVAAGTTPLRPDHREHLRGSGLSDETLRRAGICSLDERAAYALGYPAGLRGIGFPYLGTEVQVDGRPVPYTRLRVDPDRQREPGRKYENPLGHRLQKGLTYYPYGPPGVEALRKRADQPILITEGEKKTLKLTQDGWPTIGLPGVFLFADPGSSKKPAKKPLHPELRRWRLRGREVLVCFDSDRTAKEGVGLAHERLCSGLTRLGAVTGCSTRRSIACDGLCLDSTSPSGTPSRLAPNPRFRVPCGPTCGGPLGRVEARTCVHFLLICAHFAAKSLESHYFRTATSSTWTRTLGGTAGSGDGGFLPGGPCRRVAKCSTRRIGCRTSLLSTPHGKAGPPAPDPATGYLGAANFIGSGVAKASGRGRAVNRVSMAVMSGSLSLSRQGGAVDEAAARTLPEQVIAAFERSAGQWAPVSPLR